jgi:hypothetical protein
MKHKEFIIRIDSDTRIRHKHIRFKQKILRFTLQLEIHLNNKWYPVVRYDTSHNFAHKDLIHYNGKKEKTPLFIRNYNDALLFAQADLKTNLTLYKEMFIKEAQDND